MIRNFRHKGLQQLFFKNESKLISYNQEKRIRTILNIIDAADQISDINLPGFYLHKLRGLKVDIWSVRVTGNWRIIFQYEHGDAYNLDLEDYH